MKQLLLLLLTALSASGADIIPDDRKIVWLGNAGVSNGIPTVSTVFSNISAGATRAVVQSVWNACPSNQVVELAAGTYSWSDTLSLGGSGKVLRGAGMGQTIITWSGFSEASIIFTASLVDAAWSVEADLSEDAVKGENMLTLASVPSWVTVGDLIGVDQIDDGLHADGQNGFNLRTVFGNGERNISQIHRVLAKTATTITTELPNSWGWSTAQTAQIFQLGRDPSATDPMRKSGIENLTLRYTFSGTDTHPVKFNGAQDQCWLKNVEIDNMPGGRGILTYYPYRCTFTGLNIHDSHNYAGGQGYGIDLNDTATACLVENSSFSNLHLAITVRYGSGGNVIMHNSVIEGENDSLQTASYSHHGNSSFFNLIEGNYFEPKILGDWTHGASALNTVFRNRLAGQALGDYDKVVVSIEISNRFWNFSGNIMGVAGEHNKFVAHGGSTAAGSQGTIFKIGGEVNINSDYTPNDAYQFTNGSRILIHANYDTVSDSVQFDTPSGQSISETNLVDSYYLSSAPDYFTSEVHDENAIVLPWPLYDPYDETTWTNKPPAFLRAHGITNYVLASEEGGVANVGVLSGVIKAIGNVKLQGSQ